MSYYFSFIRFKSHLLFEFLRELCYARKGLILFVTDGMQQVRQHAIFFATTKHPKANDWICVACVAVYSQPPVKQPAPWCGKTNCDTYRLNQLHRSNQPTWKNSKTSQISIDAWEFLKLFMSGGYEHANSFEEVDPFGVLTAVYNCLPLFNKLREENKQHILQVKTLTPHLFLYKKGQIALLLSVGRHVCRYVR